MSEDKYLGALVVMLKNGTNKSLCKKKEAKFDELRHFYVSQYIAERMRTSL